MPSPARESRPRDDVAAQVAVGQWLVTTSGALSSAWAGEELADDGRRALEVLRDALLTAADKKSIVGLSGTLGLVAANDAEYLVSSVDGDLEPMLGAMALVLDHAAEGQLDASADKAGFDLAQQFLLSLSRIRLDTMNAAARAQKAGTWWPTTQSFSS